MTFGLDSLFWRNLGTGSSIRLGCDQSEIVIVLSAHLEINRPTNSKNTLAYFIRTARAGAPSESLILSGRQKSV